MEIEAASSPEVTDEVLEVMSPPTEMAQTFNVQFKIKQDCPVSRFLTWIMVLQDPQM